MRYLFIFTYCLLALLPTSAATLSTATTPAAPASPSKAEVPRPPAIADDNTLTQTEPEVRIIQKGEDKIEEYRLNGQLYMIKVIPVVGFPYYLIDEEGNGQMKQIDPNQRLVIPHWVLLRF